MSPLLDISNQTAENHVNLIHSMINQSIDWSVLQRYDNTESVLELLVADNTNLNPKVVNL